MSSCLILGQNNVGLLRLRHYAHILLIVHLLDHILLAFHHTRVPQLPAAPITQNLSSLHGPTRCQYILSILSLNGVKYIGMGLLIQLLSNATQCILVTVANRNSILCKLH